MRIKRVTDLLHRVEVPSEGMLALARQLRESPQGRIEEVREGIWRIYVGRWELMTNDEGMREFLQALNTFPAECPQ